jgi:hypothetical protein
MQPNRTELDQFGKQIPVPDSLMAFQPSYDNRKTSLILILVNYILSYYGNNFDRLELLQGKYNTA